MGKLSVSIADSSYDVHIGADSYELFRTDYSELLKSVDKIAIIADEHVASLHLPVLQNSLQSIDCEIVVKTVPAGESCKTIDVIHDCLSFLLENGFTRNSTINCFWRGGMWRSYWVCCRYIYERYPLYSLSDINFGP